jgi:hypothetical protein
LGDHRGPVLHRSSSGRTAGERRPQQFKTFDTCAGRSIAKFYLVA